MKKEKKKDENPDYQRAIGPYLLIGIKIRKKETDNEEEVPKIVLLESTKKELELEEKYSSEAQTIATVLEMGEEAYKRQKNEGYPPWCKVGDLIYINPYQGTPVYARDNKYEGYHLRMINDTAVRGKAYPTDIALEVDYE